MRTRIRIKSSIFSTARSATEETTESIVSVASSEFPAGTETRLV
jgi:hypothetical protein